MFNKSFFLGLITAVVALAILAVGVGVAAQGFSGAGRGEFNRGREAPAFGDADRLGGDQFNREGRGGHISFSPLRGLGGIAGNLVVIAALVGAVALGRGVYTRLTNKQANSGDVTSVPVEPTAPNGPVIEPELPDDLPAEPASPEPDNPPENNQTEA